MMVLVKKKGMRRGIEGSQGVIKECMGRERGLKITIEVEVAETEVKVGVD